MNQQGFPSYKTNHFVPWRKKALPHKVRPMTTREKIKRATKRFYICAFVLLGVAFIGTYTGSVFVILGGLIGATVSTRVFSAQTKCPMCKTPLFLLSTSKTEMNFCPSCPRSIDIDEGGETS